MSALAQALKDTGAEWMIIGGIAAIARGVRRFTTDIDAVVRGDAVGVDDLLESLGRHGIEPRVPDARAFARANLVLLVSHRPTGVDLDISLGWSSFEHDALAASTTAKYGRVSAPMAQAEDLVVFKAVAGRPKDVEDAAALLAMHPDIDVARLTKRLRELALLAEAPDINNSLDEALRLARAASPKRRRPKKRAQAMTSMTSGKRRAR